MSVSQNAYYSLGNLSTLRYVFGKIEEEIFVGKCSLIVGSRYEQLLPENMIVVRFFFLFSKIVVHLNQFDSQTSGETEANSSIGGGKYLMLQA